MSFTDAIRSGFDHYVNFEGRASRAAYWWWVLFAFIVNIVASFVDRALGWDYVVQGYSTGSGPIATVVALALLLPGLSVAVRRLHDTGRSGWWLLISVIPVIGWIMLLVFMLQPGTPGPNQFGAPPSSLPLAPGGAAA